MIIDTTFRINFINMYEYSLEASRGIIYFLNVRVLKSRLCKALFHSARAHTHTGTER